MAFDAGMLKFIVGEINSTVGGGRVEKIYQPARDELVFLIRGLGGSKRLLINAGSRCPRMGLTSVKTENPAKAPMLCMLLRKHLQGSIFKGAVQFGFDRAARLEFDTSDELGFRRTLYIIVELMGKYSNIVFCHEDGKIINVLRQIDFTDSSRRQMLPGMIYELPPAQDKLSPLDVDRDAFNALCAKDESRICRQFIMSEFAGIAPIVAREIAFSSCGDTEGTLSECCRTLANRFFDVIDNIRCEKGTPCIVFDERGIPKEYSFMPILQYGNSFTVRFYESFGEMLDTFFSEKSREERLSQKASDILKIVSASTVRIKKKLSLQQKELSDCREGDEHRLRGDLITANIYLLKRGMTGAKLLDYNTGETVSVPLDSRLTPAQNAQKYYKKYSKSKSAREHLLKQTEISQNELLYIESVAEALRHATTEKELNEIRSELYHSGFASRMKNYSEKKQPSPSYLTFKTSGGYTVLCGKNNTANDYLTFKRAERGDWWFHAKNLPGSHVVMVCAGLEEPPAEDFTEAAMIAAVYSKASDAPSAEIDYTYVRNIKKPPEAKPGLVIYHTNWSCTVPVDRERVEKMRQN